MKVLIVFWIFYASLLFSQSDCKNFNTYFEQVDDKYSDLSQNYFPNFIKIIANSLDTIKVDLNDVNGDLVYQADYIVDSSGTYILRFYNPNCPGIYFSNISIGKQPNFKKAIQITDKPYSIDKDSTTGK
jgi:hypothetical protein